MRIGWLPLLLSLGCGGAARHIAPPTLPEARQQAHHGPPAKSLQHYALAVLAQRDGDLEQAQEHIDIALLFDKDAAWLHYSAGRIHVARGELERARGDLSRAVALAPEEPRARLELATVLEIQGDYHQAAHQLEALLSQQRNDRAFADLIQLRTMTGELDEALAAMDRWLEAPPSSHRWRQRRAFLLLDLLRPAEAWEDLARLLEADGAGGPALDLLIEATQLSRRYGSTLDLLERAVQWEPGNEDMVVRLGGLAEQAGDHHRAALAWSQLDLLRGGRDPEVKLMLAQAQLSSHQAPAALAQVQAAAALDAEHPGLLELRVRALFANDRQREALDLVEAVEGWQADTNLLLLRSDLLEQAGRDLEARDSLRLALESGPQSWILAQALAPLEARTGDLEAALGLLEHYPDPLSSPAETQLRQAVVLRLAGEHEQAYTLASDAEARWPDALAPPLTQIIWMREDGLTDTALRITRDALERLPAEPVLVRQLALLEIELGAPERAIAALRICLAAHPDDPHLLNDLAYLEVEAGNHDDDVLAMARRARGFSMRLVYASRTRNQKAEADLGLHYLELGELLRQTDCAVV